VDGNNVSPLAHVRHYIDSLVHPSARQDPLTAARHRAFIAPRLLGSFAALATIPIYLAMRGVPSALELLVFAWLVAPIMIAYFLSRTGRYESAYALSALALTALVTVVAASTGGVASFAAVWLVVIPLEAAAVSRRVVTLAAAFALSAAGLLLMLEAKGFILPAASADLVALAAFGVVSAALYATGLALGVESLARTSTSLHIDDEERYRLLAHNMTDVIARHGRHGVVKFISPAAEPLFGVSIRGLEAHGLFDRVHVADRPAYLKALSDAAAGVESQSAEFRVRRNLTPAQAQREDPFVWIEMRCRPIERTAPCSDEAREVVAVMREISERKSQEQALAKAHAESERANAAKNHFLAIMSHELRTPLNVIIGFSEMLTKEESMVLDAARRHSYAQLINESGRHLLSVVNGILDMSKIDSGNFEITPEPFAPGQTVATCCDLMALKAGEAGIELVRRIAPGLPEINADKRAFSQILINLLSNAIKFTNRGGRVTVSAAHEGTAIAVAVEDNGVGIGADDLPHLGDPFFQARASYDRRHDGAGLGLSIVKGLVDLHGGALDIRSDPSIGTTVTVRLPLDCEAVRPRGRENAPANIVEVFTPSRTDAPVRRSA
jgi:two-component system, cell cycle sensor histidine kinase DivJ